MKLEQFNTIVDFVNSDAFSNLEIRRQVNNLLKKYEYSFVLAFLLKEVECIQVEYPYLAGLILSKPTEAPVWANFLTGSYDGFWTWHELLPYSVIGQRHRSDGQSKSVDSGTKNVLWRVVYDKNGN